MFAVLCVNYLPLSVSSSVLMSGVMATMLMGYLVLGEELSKGEIFTIFGGTIGILILLNPGWFGQTNPDTFDLNIS